MILGIHSFIDYEFFFTLIGKNFPINFCTFEKPVATTRDEERMKRNLKKMPDRPLKPVCGILRFDAAIT
jgi:hypothetical protein